jgi:hypothetical protein
VSNHRAEAATLARSAASYILMIGITDDNMCLYMAIQCIALTAEPSA